MHGTDLASLRGQLAVVTGAASGIGAAIAESCAMYGMAVLLADVEEEALERTVTSLRRRGATATGRVVGVRDPLQVDSLAEEAAASGETGSRLCNNAGVGVVRSFLETTLEDWRWTLEVNLWGVLHGVRAFLPRMLEQRCRARIVNTASAAGLLAPADLSAYAVSKHGVVALSESLQAELAAAASDVRLVVLCPGLVRTNIHQAERNRPRRHHNPDEILDRGDELAEAMEAAMTPEELTRILFAALERGDFLVCSHGETPDQLRARCERLLSGEGPPPPWPDQASGEAD